MPRGTEPWERIIASRGVCHSECMTEYKLPKHFESIGIYKSVPCVHHEESIQR